MIHLYLGNNLDVLKGLEDNSIDSCVTDPPYELNFMNNKWDSSGIAYNVDLWKEIYRVLKPGAHLLSFGGTRTYHRMACAIEDAGFEIRDQIQWIYGQGFPKSMNISKAIDATLLCGNSGTRKLREVEQTYGEGDYKLSGVNNGILGEKRVYDRKTLEPQTDEAKYWSGWGTCLKPTNEPICVARKPISEKTIALNVLKWGTGGLNIDGCRIELNGEIVPINKLENWSGFGQEVRPDYEQKLNNKGRFPANTIFDEEAGRLLDYQSGFTKGSDSVRHCNQSKTMGKKNDAPCYGEYGDVESKGYADMGGASRFFYCAKASKKERNAGLDSFKEKAIHRYGAGIGEGKTPEAPTFDKNFHPTVKPVDLMRYLCLLVTPPNGTVLDPFMGSGSTGIGANKEGFGFIGIELNEDYYRIAKARVEGEISGIIRESK